MGKMIVTVIVAVTAIAIAIVIATVIAIVIAIVIATVIAIVIVTVTVTVTVMSQMMTTKTAKWCMDLLVPITGLILTVVRRSVVPAMVVFYLRVGRNSICLKMEHMICQKEQDLVDYIGTKFEAFGFHLAL